MWLQADFLKKEMHSCLVRQAGHCNPLGMLNCLDLICLYVACLFLACWLSVSTQGSKVDARALRCTDTKSVCMWAPVGLLHKVQAYCKMHCWFSIRTLLQYCTHATALTTCGIQMYCTLCLALCLLPAKKKQQKKGPSKASASYSLCDAVQHGCSMLCLTWQNAWNWRAALLCPHMPVIDGFAESQERSPGPTWAIMQMNQSKMQDLQIVLN